MSEPKPKKLTDQQQLFVLEYLECWNATEAYLASHPKCTKRTTAKNNGSRALANAYIRAAIDARLKEKAMGADEVLARLAEQGRMTIADFVLEDAMPTFDKEGNQTGEVIVVGLNWPAIRKHGHLIKSLANTPNGPRIELHDGQAALVHIGKHLKLFTDQVDVTSGGGPIILNVVYQDKNAIPNNPPETPSKTG
jgi:phage terminase small subunit